MRRTSPSPVPIRRPRPPQPHTFTHMVDSIKTPSTYARRAGGPAQSPHGQPRLVGHLGDTRTQQAEQSTEPMRWTSKKQAAREPSNGSEHHQQGGGGRNRQQKNTTTTATAPHYEAGPCEDGGLRLLPVTHQRAKGTTHTTRDNSSKGPRQIKTVSGKRSNDRPGRPTSPAPPTATRTRAVSTADGEQQPAMGTTTDKQKHGRRGTGPGP